MLHWIRCAVGLSVVCVVASAHAAAPVEQPQIDQIVLGDSASEKSHEFSTDHAEVCEGALDETARRLLPLSPASHNGGWIAFTMKVDPQRQNYVTAKFWGSDKGQGAGRLLLYAEGLQAGYRHEADYDVLNQCDDEGEAPGRFFFETVPLPLSLTRGKNTLSLKIASLGPMWPYGTTFTQYQKDLTQPTRGIYRVYTHTNPRFVPDPSEKQGKAPEAAVRMGPGEEVIAESKQTVVKRLSDLLAKPMPAGRTSGQKDRLPRLKLMAEAWSTSWTPAFHDLRAIEQIIQDGDSLAADFASKPAFAESDWSGAGPLGEALVRTWPEIKKRLDQSIIIAGSPQLRREAWANALRKSIDYWRTHRRSYTNQSMIVDWNLYTANRGLHLLQPNLALPEERAIRYVYEAVGLEPWLGSDTRNDGLHVQDTPDRGTAKPFGSNYYLITRKGLSRELGWVGTYGETILHFTCEMAEFTGDEKIRQQLAKIQHARMYFRYPGLDAEGYRCMKLASEMDNRTAHFPLSGSAYAAPNVRESWWMEVPALLEHDSIAAGAAQQSLADGQYFAYVRSRLRDADTLGMMRNVDQYAKVKSLAPSAYRLPATPGQADFAFADEEDAVVAFKDGDAFVFANLYYRAERAVNGVARVLEISPTMTRLSTLRIRTEADSSGRTYTRPDWIDGIRSRGLPPPGEDIHQAWAGEVLPIARRPDDATMPAYGNWGPFVGKAALYEARYGPWLILMNSSQSREFPLNIPSEFAGSRDLVSGKSAAQLGDASLKPLTTIILRASDQPVRR